MKWIWHPLHERRDERVARRLRGEFGRRGWLLSWHRLGIEGPWQARVSCRSLPDTIERVGRSRRQAIERATQALETLLTEV